MSAEVSSALAPLMCPAWQRCPSLLQPSGPDLQAAWLLLAPCAPVHLALLRHAYVTSNICSGGSHPYRLSLDCSNFEMPRQPQRVFRDCNRLMQQENSP